MTIIDKEAKVKKNSLDNINRLKINLKD